MNQQNDPTPTSFPIIIACLLIAALILYGGVLLMTGYLEGNRALEFICNSPHHSLASCNR